MFGVKNNLISYVIAQLLTIVWLFPKRIVLLESHLKAPKDRCVPK